MDSKQLKDILQKENVLVVFYADWCQACKVAAPLIQKIAEKLNIRVIRINENDELEQEYAVDYYPHLIMSKNGIIRSYPGLDMVKNLYESCI